MNALFRKFAQKTSEWMGSSWSFMVAGVVILIWGLTGPMFHFSDTWQLVINTGTTIVTFLMVFLIQNTQNRDAVATHLKLDELIRAIKGARTRLVHLENYTDEELAELQKEFERLHDRLDRQRTTTAARRVEVKTAAVVAKAAAVQTQAVVEDANVEAATAEDAKAEAAG